MITERELRQIAGKTGLGVGQAEHEYAMLCVLDALGQTSSLSDTFCLKGGTALRLIYFDDWRHSVDRVVAWPSVHRPGRLTNLG